MKDVMKVALLAAVMGSERVAWKAVRLVALMEQLLVEKLVA